uniref:Ionotropic glutamate receptor C-terminal domain-containing protein n=2 Tax=Musca domestica TaxID=7370 RepID=A0A1I8N7D3_MUSDO
PDENLEIDPDLRVHVDEFILRLHQLYFKSVIFYDTELFFRFVEASLAGSIESVNLIFRHPDELTSMILDRKLAHRLGLFIFYWGAKHPPKRSEINFREPMRAVVITRPRKKAFRIYYNQAHPDGNGHLSLVSWYDGDNLGLSKEPLLPPASQVYSNFHGRIFRVPVFHSPPWFWVNYENDTAANSTMDSLNSDESYANGEDEGEGDMELSEVNVTGGRDHRLLQLLAKHMNFEFVYIDTPGRTQGSLVNETFTGGIGLLRNGLGDFFLGDVSLSWERRKAIEFSFFTLADSGAFATHAPRRLNEALAILRPFKADVWPYLILTVIVSGPVFYFIIYIPFRWQADFRERQMKKKIKRTAFHMVYIQEITRMDNRVARRFAKAEGLSRRSQKAEDELPDNLFNKCIWFTVQLFLKQSCQELYHGYRAKFLMIVYWIAATYVLADVYSAQLTSQFARPAREPPINTLHRLQKAMIQDGYLLFVERESSSLEMLE